MDTRLSVETSKQYNELVSFSEWSDRNLKALNSRAKKPDRQLDKQKWNNIMSHYMIDIAMFPDQVAQFYMGLIEFVSHHTEIRITDIYEIFQSDYKSLVDTRPKKVTGKITRPGGKYRVRIGDVTMNVPASVLRMIPETTYENIEDKYIRMFLRYKMLGVDTGYFWSFPPDAYVALSNLKIGGRKPPESVECFASPFNRALPKFCSMFEEDLDLDYDEGSKCLGNFFSYVANLNRPKRLMFNPPYTDSVIASSCQALISYMEEVDGEFVALLPNWQSFEPIVDLMTLEGSASRVLDPETYKIYNYDTEKEITFSRLSFILICNVRLDKQLSDHLLEKAYNLISDD